MTYLELCKAVVRECGIDRGATPVPITVDDQIGDLRSVVEWVKQAWIEIQSRNGSWRWMRSRFELETADTVKRYPYSSATDERTTQTVDRFGRWILFNWHNPPKIYRKSDGIGAERWLVPVSWRDYRIIYDIGNGVQDGPPVHITVDPQNNIVLGPTPDDVYVVSGEYQMSPQILTEDGSKPDMPEQFHYLIVYEAMRKYAGFESAGEVMSRAVLEGRPLLRALERNQLPGFGGRPLA